MTYSLLGTAGFLINEVKRYIEEHFQIKDLGPVKTMLGIIISHNIADDLLTMDQSMVIININLITMCYCRVTVERK